METNEADIPIPSVEGNGNGNGNVQIQANGRRAISPASSDASNSISPVILTPPISSPGGASEPTPDIDGVIVADLGNMRLSSPHGLENLNGLGRALDDAVREPNSARLSATPEPRQQGSGENTAGRNVRSRRSSSRAVQERHEVRNEEPPADIVNSAQFQSAFTDARQVMVDFEHVLSRSSLGNDSSSKAHDLHMQAKELATFQFPSNRIVGFVGDTEAGKSTLLNSLLDIENLARSSSNGQACTCVATEFHYHTQDTLDIQVELFDPEELGEQLRSLLQSYRCFHLSSQSFDSNEERQEAEERATKAMDTFNSMFRGKLHDRNILLSSDEADTLEVLNRWASESMPSPEMTSRVTLSVEECSQALICLSSELDHDRTPAMWPFIKRIKVFSNAHILSTGLILVDLPGLRDRNLARRHITESYLKRCHEIIAVCRIGRAVDDQSVRDVFNLAKRAGLSRVGIVCTRSEDINAQEALKESSKEVASTIRQHLDAISGYVTEIASVNEQLSEFDGLPADDRFPEDIEEEVALNRRLRNLKSLTSQREFMLARFLMTNRNDSVTRQLKRTYAAFTPSYEIPVFCVSNTMYWDNRNSASVQYLDLSGIIAARRHFLSIVVSSQRRAAVSFVNTRVPAFLAQVDLWLQSGARSASQEQREQTCRLLHEVESQFLDVLGSDRSAFLRAWSESSKQEFSDRIYERREGPRWTRCAADATQEWCGWSHPSFSAFCRKYGTYSTSAVGTHSWNEEALAAYLADNRASWERLGPVLNRGRRPLIDAIRTNLSDAAERLEQMPDPRTSAALVNAVRTQRQVLLDQMEQSFDKLDDALNSVRIDALTGIPTSCIGTLMRPAYEACNLERGGGSDARRKTIIVDAFTDPLLFTKLMRAFRNTFNAAIMDSHHDLYHEIVSGVETIRANFDLVRDESSTEENEQDPDFANRVRGAVQQSWAQITEAQAQLASLE